jgi:uncharacterized membrane protein
MVKKKEKIVVKKETVKVGENHGIIKTIMTESGHIVSKTFSPLMTNFEKKDIAQVFIGSLLLASPFMVTEEVWALGAELSVANAALFFLLTIFSLITLIYYTKYRSMTVDGHIHKSEFLKRVIGTYLISFITVAVLLTLLDKAPWETDVLIALKRTILIALPATLGGATADLVR